MEAHHFLKKVPNLKPGLLPATSKPEGRKAANRVITWRLIKNSRSDFTSAAKAHYKNAVSNRPMNWSGKNYWNELPLLPDGG